MIDSIVNLIDSGDTFSLLATIAILSFIGRRAVSRQGVLRIWGWRFALLAFLAYAGFKVIEYGVGDSVQLAGVAFRGLLAGGLALGASWIALAIISFVHCHTLGALSRQSRNLRHQWELKAHDAQVRRTEEERRQRDRERADLERQQAQRKKEREQQQRRDQKRREDVRFACESFYDRHRGQLEEKFSQNRLDEYFERYLGDDHPADEVEQRAAQLRAMLQELLDADGNGRPRFQSIVELREFYHQERLRIDSAEMEVDLKDTLLSDLAREEELAIREFRKR